MARPTSRPARAALAAAAAALFATGCTGSGGADPLPTGNPSTTDPQPTTIAPTFDEQTAAELFVAWRDAIHGLPPTPAGEVNVEAAGAGIVVPDSPAAEDIASALERAIDTGVLDRGDVHAEILELRTTGDDTRQATVCASLDVEFTRLETGEPAQSEAKPSDIYQRAEATYRVVDGTWLLEEVTGGDPQNCVPPSIAERVEGSWETFTTAWLAWERSGGKEVDEILRLVTEDFAPTFQDVHFDPASSPAPHTDLRLRMATRTRVEGDWCRRGHLNDGVWELVDADWLISAAGQMGPDPQEESRCP